jgi:hypothetical protein
MATRRTQYLKRLAAQSRAGDLGATVELELRTIRDVVALGGPVPIRWCDGVLAGVRKLRRRAMSEDEAWLRRQLKGLGKNGGHQ